MQQYLMLGVVAAIQESQMEILLVSNGNTAPEKAELTVQVSSAPSTVQITGYSYTQS